jgi:hypothetical protein
MKTLTLDAAGWQDANDVYDAFFRAVGALTGMAGTSTRSAIALQQARSIRLRFRIGLSSRILQQLGNALDRRCAILGIC